jgi:hypothetical protein
MKISGFTFLKNGTLLGYPYLESIRSLLPLVDELVVAIGQSEDDTLERVRALARAQPRIPILESSWNERMSQKGFVYAQQKMLAQFNCTGDWAFYLEGDEVLHEAELPAIRAAMERHLEDPRVEALAFDYLHFYGMPGQIAASPAWYRREARIIRNTIRSYAPDGQFWVVMDGVRRGRYPRAAMSGARIFHYGHVRLRERMQAKNRCVSKYWDNAPPGEFDYGRIDPQALRPFQGTHPAVVREWLATEAERTFAPTPGYHPTRRERKHRWVMRLERLLGADLSKRHFDLVR